MKKLLWTFCVALIFTNMNTYADCLSPCNFDVFVPKLKGGFKFTLGLGFIRPAISQLDYALTFSGDQTFNSLNPGYDVNTYDAGIGYTFPCTGNDVQLSYSQFTDDEFEIKHQGGQLSSTITEPTDIPIITDTVVVIETGGIAIASGTIIDPDRVAFIEGSYSSKQKKWDLDFGQNIHISRDFRLRFLGGLRSVNLVNKFATALGIDTLADQTVVLTGEAEDPTVPGGIIPFSEIVSFSTVDLEYHHKINQKSSYWGIGPRFGLDANYYMDIGISFFASMSTSLLVGDINSFVTATTRSSFSGRVDDVVIITPEDTLLPTLTPGDFISEQSFNERGINSPEETRIVPNLEAKLGLSYFPCLPCTCSRVYIEGGYMVNHYFNAIDRLTDINSLDVLPRRHIQDLTFDGFYLKVGLRL